MHTANSLDDDIDKLWNWAAQQLERVYMPAQTDENDLSALRAWLPKREVHESLAQWLQRCQTQLQNTQKWHEWQQLMGNLDKVQKINFIEVAQIIRLAADTRMETYPLPEADMPLESSDGVFRLFITAIAGHKIRLHLQVRGIAAQDYVGQRLGIKNIDAEALLAELLLGDYANGEVEIDDTVANRQALLALSIGKLVNVEI